MVSFARARAKSWLTRVWPASFKTNRNKSAEMDTSKELIKSLQQQNKCFFEASKNGGIWFS